MSIDHEAPMRALAERVQTYCRDYIARPVSRRQISFDQLGQAEQAAIMVVANSHTAMIDGPAPAQWIINASIVVLARADADPSSSAEPILNKVIGAIESALERQPDETAISPGQQIQRWTTLGGVVQWAQPESVELADGSQGNEGIAVFNVNMLPQPA